MAMRGRPGSCVLVFVPRLETHVPAPPVYTMLSGGLLVGGIMLSVSSVFFLFASVERWFGSVVVYMI